MSTYNIRQYDAFGIKLRDNSQAQLSVSGTASQTGVFASDGMYDVWADIDVYVKVAPTANDVTTSTGYLIRANNTVPVLVGDGDRIGAIAAGSGTLRYHKVS